MKDRELELSLKSLANVRRLSIVRFIKKKKEVSVSDIASEINLSIRSTSRHLYVLFSAHILEREQKNIYVFYRMSPDIAEPVKSIIMAL